MVLACFASSKSALYEPVQIQKLIFLFQEQASPFFRVKPFTFRAYDYGPFDSDIYTTLERLANQGLVEIIGQPYNRNRYYKLAEAGHPSANSALEAITEPYKTYLIQLAEWVQSLSFAQLVGAIYKDYPEMRKNSIFQDRS